LTAPSKLTFAFVDFSTGTAFVKILGKLREVIFIVVATETAVILEVDGLLVLAEEPTQLIAVVSLLLFNNSCVD